MNTPYIVEQMGAAWYAVRNNRNIKRFGDTAMQGPNARDEAQAWCDAKNNELGAWRIIPEQVRIAVHRCGEDLDPGLFPVESIKATNHKSYLPSVGWFVSDHCKWQVEMRAPCGCQRFLGCLDVFINEAGQHVILPISLNDEVINTWEMWKKNVEGWK